jgi:ParB-like chromosome segregation protein Spo0J
MGTKEYVVLSLSEIKPYSKNEKIHTKENMALIRESMREVGYINNIIVDEENTILAGHGRYFVLLEDQVEEIEVSRISGLSNVQKNKFRLYDNQSARTGKDDNELLLQTVEDILGEDSSFNISILAIDGLAESFSEEIFSADLGTSKLTKTVEKLDAIVILTDSRDSICDLLDKNNIQYSLGHATK